jgi:hypothetical protein
VAPLLVVSFGCQLGQLDERSGAEETLWRRVVARQRGAKAFFGLVGASEGPREYPEMVVGGPEVRVRGVDEPSRRAHAFVTTGRWVSIDKD